MLTIGIDPGVSGAIALIDRRGVPIAVCDMPVAGRDVAAAALAATIRNRYVRAAYVEKVGPMPKQGVVSMFRFGRALGAVEGVLAGLKIPLVLVPPVTWKKYHGLVRNDKDDSRKLALQRWPYLAEKLSKKRDIGRAEALLIADYGFSQYREPDLQDDISPPPVTFRDIYAQSNWPKKDDKD